LIEMKVPMTVLKVVTVWPAVLVSFVLAMVVLVLAPPVLALPLFLAAVVLLGALATGRLEAPAVQLLTGVRAAGDGERTVVAGLLAALSALGVENLDLQVRRRQRPSTPAVAVLGRRSLVMTPGLIEALYREWVATEEAVALVGQAVGARHARRPRCEVAVLAATAPWRAVLAVFRGVAAAFAWLPFMRVTWALRGVVAVICVAQSLIEGRAAAGLLGGTVIALTYAVPAAGRALQARTELAGDRFVVERGLGGVLLGLLSRYGHPMPLERSQRLAVTPVSTAAEQPSRPALRLVPNQGEALPVRRPEPPPGWFPFEAGYSSSPQSWRPGTPQEPVMHAPRPSPTCGWWFMQGRPLKMCGHSVQVVAMVHSGRSMLVAQEADARESM
jgi:hypothetical protein